MEDWPGWRGRGMGDGGGLSGGGGKARSAYRVISDSKASASVLPEG